MYSIKTGFSFIFPSFPCTLDRFLVSSSNNFHTNPTAKFLREQLLALMNFISSESNTPLGTTDVTVSKQMHSGGVTGDNCGVA